MGDMRAGARRTGAAAAVALAVCTPGACGGSGAEAPRVEMADSAGVRIVVNRGAVERVELDLDDPLVRVAGEEEGGAPFYQVRGGVLLTDGFALADGGNHQVRRYDAAGVAAWTRGREGEAPGEYRSILWIEAREGGGFHVGDPGSRRVTALHSDGTTTWTRNFRPSLDITVHPPDAVTAPQPVALTAFGEGSLVGYAGAVAVPKGRPGPLPLRAELELHPSDTSLTPVPLARISVIVWHESPGAEGFPVTGLYGAARMWWGSHSGRLAVTSSERPEILVIDRGSLTLALREDRALEPFRPDSLPTGNGAAADSVPAYHDLRVDGLHRIWARITPEENERGAVWRLFDQDGVALADVGLPADARPLDASAERLLVLRRDAFAVERVELHPAPAALAP